MLTTEKKQQIQESLRLLAKLHATAVTRHRLSSTGLGSQSDFGLLVATLSPLQTLRIDFP